MKDPDAEELRTILEGDEFAQCELLATIPADDRLITILIWLALEGGGTLVLDLRSSQRPVNPFTVAEILDKLKSLAASIPFQTSSNATKIGPSFIPHVSVPPLPDLPPSLLDLTSNQSRLLIALGRASASGRFGSEFVASSTFDPGWFVILPGKEGNASKQITGFEETDLHALREEGLITLIARRGQYNISLKAAGLRRCHGAVQEVLSGQLARNDASRTEPDRRDIFLCHAGEQKTAVVEPLAAALRAASISYWYDSEEILWGDSVASRINEGLARCRFVVTVLSSAFEGKPWPERELNTALSREPGGTQRVLPLLVGTPQERQAIFARYLLLSDKRYLVWDGDAGPVVRELLKVLS